MRLKYSEFKMLVESMMNEIDVNEAEESSDEEVEKEDSKKSLDAGSSSDDSIDAQVDKYFVEFESNAKVSDVSETLVRESDDTKTLSIDDINMEKFVTDVVRLIENYDNLLEIRDTLVKRAKTFLGKNYTDEVVKTFEDVLRDAHSIEIGKTERQSTSDKSNAPAAIGAGIASGGGGGGAAI